jgi:uncharacterized protein VirK/YbjX
MSFQALKGLSKIPNPRSLRVRDPYVSSKLLKGFLKSRIPRSLRVRAPYVLPSS